MPCPSCGARRPSAPASATNAVRSSSRRARRVRRAGDGRRQRPEAGDRRVVTALFADLVDYVRMIAEHDPEEVRARVGAALARMADAIERLDGTREKFIGDAVFAVFGWPRAHDDDPVRAALAALAIRAALREPVDGGEPLEVRIGLATGEVVAGARRRPATGDLAVTGEAITTAARIQSLARPGEILLDEATVRAARDRLATDDRGSVVLRGQSIPVQLFALRGEAGMGAWSPHRPVLAGRCGLQAPTPASPRSANSWTAIDWPRSTTEPWASVANRPRAARRVASSSRISPGRAIDWIRAAVVIASPVTARSPVPVARAAATTSPVARPIRTSSGSPPSSGSSSVARIANAARAARTGSSSWACGQPKTANTASPMNFSRVPRGARWHRPSASAAADPRADLLGVVLGEHPHVVDEVGEQRGHDAPVAGVQRRRLVGAGAAVRVGELGTALIAEPGAARCRAPQDGHCTTGVLRCRRAPSSGRQRRRATGFSGDRQHRLRGRPARRGRSSARPRPGRSRSARGPRVPARAGRPPGRRRRHPGGP